MTPWMPTHPEGDGDGGGDGGRILRVHQAPHHHAQGFHIPFGSPLTPIYTLLLIHLFLFYGLGPTQIIFVTTDFEMNVYGVQLIPSTQISSIRPCCH